MTAAVKSEWTAQGYMGRTVTRTGYIVAEHFGVSKVPGKQRWMVDHIPTGLSIGIAAADTLARARANAEQIALIIGVDWSSSNPVPMDFSNPVPMGFSERQGFSFRDAVTRAVESAS